MLQLFLEKNRAAVIDRCRARAAGRLAPRPLPEGDAHGVPALLGQLIETLRLERSGDSVEGTRPPAAFGVAGVGIVSAIGATAARHAQELFLHGLTIDHLVHGYGDLLQAIVELAIERNAPVRRDEFAIVGRCVEQASVDAINEFNRLRDRQLSNTDPLVLGERLGLLTRELRRHLNTAMLCFVAIKEGGLGLEGATSGMLERSLVSLNDLLEHALRDVRADVGAPAHMDQVQVELFMAEARVAASLEARSRGCELIVSPVEPGLVVHADTQMLHSAVFGLLQNAFELTRPPGHVRLKAYATAERVLIEVEDQSGGLAEGEAGGPGSGLSITRQAVEAMGGSLRFRDLPGIGCVSTIELPRPVRRDGA